MIADLTCFQITKSPSFPQKLNLRGIFPGKQYPNFRDEAFLSRAFIVRKGSDFAIFQVFEFNRFEDPDSPRFHAERDIRLPTTAEAPEIKGVRIIDENILLEIIQSENFNESLDPKFYREIKLNI